MSGFEIIGVVLGSIPLMISALEHYERGLMTVRVLQNRAKMMHALATSLSTEETILRNTCETLLAGIVDPEDLQLLVADPFGPLWQDPNTKALIERRLDHTLKDFKALVHSMNEAIEEMRSKLGLNLDSEFKFENGSVAIRDMIKIALRFPTHENSLKRLADMNQKLHMMMIGNLQNEPYRRFYSQHKLFNLLRAMSRSIYNALISSLSCKCAELHGVGFGLNTPRLTGQAQNAEALVKRLDFHLILLNNLQDTEGKGHSTWVWDQLVLRLAEDPTQVRTATHMAERRLRRVGFLDKYTRDQAMASQAFDAPHQPGVRAPGVNTQLPQEAGRLVQVKNICQTLTEKSSGRNDKDPYGYLLDEATRPKHKFEVFPFRSSNDQDQYTTIRLMDVFSRKQRPSLARRYHIAATAASSILLTHETLWVPSTPGTKNFYLVSRNGSVDFDEIYLARESLRDSKSLKTTPDQNRSSEGAGALTLRHLSIFLVEVMLWKPVYECCDDEGIDSSGIPLEEIFDYTTAKGFNRIESILKRIEWLSSPDYKEVVKHCITCDLDGNRYSLDDNTFRQAIYNNIVLPLHNIDRFASEKLTVGKGK